MFGFINYLLSVVALLLQMLGISSTASVKTAKKKLSKSPALSQVEEDLLDPTEFYLHTTSLLSS